MWNAIWQTMMEKREQLNAQNGYSCLHDGEAFRYALGGRAVSRGDAIAALKIAVETIQGYMSAIRAIRGSNRDPDITNQLALCAKYVGKYLNEITSYERATDERFRAIFPTLLFRDIPITLQGLKFACDSLVTRGPRYNPPH